MVYDILMSQAHNVKREYRFFHLRKILSPGDPNYVPVGVSIQGLGLQIRQGSPREGPGRHVVFLTSPPSCKKEECNTAKDPNAISY